MAVWFERFCNQLELNNCRKSQTVQTKRSLASQGQSSPPAKMARIECPSPITMTHQIMQLLLVAKSEWHRMVQRQKKIFFANYFCCFSDSVFFQSGCVGVVVNLLLFQSALCRCCESVTVVVAVCPVQVLLSICHCCCCSLPCAGVVVNLSLLLLQSALCRCCCQSVTVVVSVCPVQVLLSICHCCCCSLPCAGVIVNMSLLLLQSAMCRCCCESVTVVVAVWWRLGE